MKEFEMFDKNGRRIWDGDYVTNPIASGVVTGRNNATVLVRVMDDAGHQQWVSPNESEIIDDPDNMEAPESPSVEVGYDWDDEVTTWSGKLADGRNEW